jgi:uncharacterized protein HemX
MSYAITAVAAAAVIGAGVSYYNGQQQAAASKAALAQAKETATKNAQQADEAYNAANKRTADTSALLSAAQQSGKAGASGTMLTGSSGVDTSSLQLGKNTLLGS